MPNPIREAVRRHLPAPLLVPAQRTSRRVRQILGRSASKRSPGAVCMYHVGRCGSTVLGNLLDQHPRVYWDQEIYFRRWREAGLKIRPFDHRAFVQEHRWAAGPRYYGFEIKFLDNQHLAIAQADLATCIADYRASGVTHHIVLRRNNHLRTLISWVAGRERGQHHIKSGAKAARSPVHLDTETLSFGVVPVKRDLIAWFEHIDRAYDGLEAMLEGLASLRIAYEDDVRDDPQVAYGRCCDFLQIKREPVEVRFSRTNPYPVEQMLANHAEVASLLAGTPYAWMLDE